MIGTASTALQAQAGVVDAPTTPISKEKLMVPPPTARHDVIQSASGKHGDSWSWTLPNGHVAYRLSMNLRGWITEEDEEVSLDGRGRTTALVVRGFSESGDQAEQFHVDRNGIAHWATKVDAGSSPINTKVYSAYGGPPLGTEQIIAVLIAAGDKGIDLLPTGHASIHIGSPVTINGAHGTKVLRLAFIDGFDFSPTPVWLDAANHLFGLIGETWTLPDGSEDLGPQLKVLQDSAIASMVRNVAHQFLTAANRTPTLVDRVLLFDSIAGEYLPNRAVLIAEGKVVAMGAAGSIKTPANAVVIDGTGKTILPGLWDSHQHVGGDDWNLLQNIATGITNYRSPGTQIDDALSIYKRRAAGDLLAPDGKISVIVDQKGPLADNGGLVVTSEAETIAAIDKIHAAGLWGVKFYTSMNPAWIAPGAAEAHRLGLHVHGHVPAGMRPLDAVHDGYDELTHINFIMMQAMPQAVVDKSNTAARVQGPAKYGKDVDLDSPLMKAFYAELARRKITVDPTLSLFETEFTSDGSAIAPAYAPFAQVAPPTVARGWKTSGYPLFDGLTREDFRRSFAKMVGLVGRLHAEGVPIVAGTDDLGLELVRELELYQQAGLSNAEALQTGTINPACLTGMADHVGSIEPGKTADVILVDGDVSKALSNLRQVDTVFLDGYRLDGAALRRASGLSGVPR